MTPAESIRTKRRFMALGAAVLLALATWTWFAPTAGAQGEEQLELGQRVYDQAAGGVGCAYCHGLDGRGQGTAGVDAPNIVGAQESALRSSLAGAVPLMNFITLTEPEFEAVHAYLQYLALPPAEREAAPAAGPEEPEEPQPDAPEPEAPEAEEPEAVEAEPEETSADAPASTAGIPGPTGILTFNIAVTDEGFSPSSISIPVGRTAQIVLRNRTFDEHHFRIQGLEVEDLMWIQNMGETPPTADDMAGHDHHDHADHGEHDVADDHDHAPAGYVAWRAESPAGIQPSGDEVHAWAYTYSPGGGRDVVIFTPVVTGTFVVDNPLHPGMTAEVIVHD